MNSGAGDRSKGAGSSKASDYKTLDSGAGVKGKGAGRDEAGGFKTLDNGAGDRGKGAGHNEAGDRARPQGATRPETPRPATTRQRPAPPTMA